MTKILYIPEGRFLSYYKNTTFVFEDLNVDFKYKNNPELYLAAVITACNNSNLCNHIWGLPENSKFLRSEFEIIYD